MSSKLPVVPLVSSSAWCRCLRLMATWLIFGACIVTSPAWATQFSSPPQDSLLLSWTDNAEDESHYLVSRRQGLAGDFETLAVLPADSSEFLDAAVTGGEIYCYRVQAGNEAGMSTAVDACAIAPPLDDELDGWGEITAEAMEAPESVDIAGREFLTLNNWIRGNDQASAAAIGLPDFVAVTGEESTAPGYPLVGAAGEVDAGMRQVNFDEFNTIAFTLTGSGEWQTASLWLRVGAWGEESAGIVVTAGGNRQLVPLAAVNEWQHIKVSIAFAENVQVVLRPDRRGLQDGALGLAAIMLEEVDDGTVEPWAQISSSVHRRLGVVDVTDLEYRTGHQDIYGNLAASPVEIGMPQWSVIVGEMKSRHSSRIEFWQGGQQVDTGYTKMRFDEANTLDVALAGDATERIAVFYLAVKVWHRQRVSFSVMAANAEHEVELPTSFGWHYFQVRMAFKGELNVRFRPNGHLNKYSTLGFGGVVIIP